MIDFASPVTLADATSIQEDLRQRVRIENDFGTLETLAGVDVSYDIQNNLTRAFIILFDATTLHIRHRVKAVLPTDFPYIPGFLSFREIPAILAALDQLNQKPDILIVDGQGIAHPRRLGIAAHLGVLTDLPAIGVAKSRLAGWNKEPGPHKGDRSDLIHQREKIGTVLRSKEKTKPLFISPGHRVDHDTAVALTLQCLTRYRLPEPTRLADKWSKEKGQDDDPAPLLL